MLSSSFQRTALHRAARIGHVEACELLIAGKADVDAKDMCAFMLKCVADFVLYFVFEIRL